MEGESQTRIAFFGGQIYLSRLACPRRETAAHSLQSDQRCIATAIDPMSKIGSTEAMQVQTLTQSEESWMESPKNCLIRLCQTEGKNSKYSIETPLAPGSHDRASLLVNLRAPASKEPSGTALEATGGWSKSSPGRPSAGRPPLGRRSSAWWRSGPATGSVNRCPEARSCAHSTHLGLPSPAHLLRTHRVMAFATARLNATWSSMQSSGICVL